MGMPEIEVSIAFDSGYTTPAASRTWTDVTAYVEAGSHINITRGRADEFGSVSPSTLSLTLDNKDGRFTPEYVSGAYYPNVKKGRPIRVRARWVVGGGGTWYDRFVGYVNTWPVEWPGGSTAYSTVTVSASSRMARLSQNAEFKSIVEEEILYDSPVLYYPLGEPAGALEAGNIAVGHSERLVVTQVGSGGTLTFGAGTGPGTDDLTAPVLAAVDSVNGKFLLADFGPVLPSNVEVGLEVWVNCPSATANNQLLLTLENVTVGAVNPFAFGIETNGKVTMLHGAGVSNITTAASICDGNTHHLAGRWSYSGGTMTKTFIVDGVVVGTTAVAYAGPPAFTRLIVGATSSTTTAYTQLLTSGTLAHVALYSSTVPTNARFIEHYNAGANGFTADASGARVARYARLAGVPVAETTTETGLSTSIAHIDTTGQSPVEAMQRVAVTEDGVVFDGRDGSLTFQARSHRYGATSALTLSCTAGEVEADLRPVLDDQGLTNDMTASRAGGATARSVNQASINENGYYRDTVELATTSDNEVQSRAEWQVNRFGTPRVKVTSVSVDVIPCSSAQVTALLAADLGTRFTVSNLPAQAPASTMDFFIEGASEEIGAEFYQMKFNTSSAGYANVALWDSGIWDQSIWAY